MKIIVLGVEEQIGQCFVNRLAVLLLVVAAVIVVAVLLCNKDGGGLSCTVHGRNFSSCLMPLPRFFNAFGRCVCAM